MNTLKKRKLFLNILVFGTLAICLIIWYVLPAQTPVYLANEFRGYGDKNRLLFLLIALPFVYLPHEHKTNHAESEESNREFEKSRLRDVKRQLICACIVCGLLLALYGTVCFQAFVL